MNEPRLHLPAASPLLECVPNFSEGRDAAVLEKIGAAIESVPEVALLDTEPGAGAHRTVMTFAGAPDAVSEAAFRAVEISSRLIDMRLHHGVHPRMGATDVCPLVPLTGVTLEETAVRARRLGQRIGEELALPVYLYGAAARRPDRENLARVRRGGYEGLPARLQRSEEAPDYGPAAFVPRFGAVAVGARDLLVAFNVNLAAASAAEASAIAAEVRESGRLIRPSGPNAEAIRQPGRLPAVRAIGWWIEEYGLAQVSMNLVDLRVTPLHVAYAAVREVAAARGIEVTGSELVGLIPLASLLAAGRYFQPVGEKGRDDEEELVESAIRGLGLDQLAPFDPRRKVLEYRLRSRLPALVAGD